VLAPAPFDLDGDAYGIILGYNVQSGALVYGGELAYQNSSVDLVSTAPFVQEYEQLIDLKGRIGYASGSLLAYGVLGYSWNDYNLNNTASSSGDGFAYGLGLDYRVSETVFVGAEYLHRSMDNDAVFGINALDADLSTFSLRLGLAF
jgi:outer membrane immunogenic protein